MIRLALLLPVLLGWASQGLAQQYDRMWVFGNNCGLDFTVPDTPKVFYPNIHSTDIVASFSPEIGDSLIYIDTHAGSRFPSIYAIKPVLNGQDYTNLNGINNTTTGQDTFLFVPKEGPTLSPIFLDMKWSKFNYTLVSIDFMSRIDPIKYNKYGFSMFLTEIRCDSNGCEVVSKNKSDNRFLFLEKKLCAVRHANGIDWWIITKSTLSDTFVKFLLTQNGMVGPFKQKIGGQKYLDDYGYLIASPQGDRLLNMGWTGRIDLFDFDRCNGELSNYIFLGSNLRNEDCDAIDPNSINKGLWGGGGFSPDGKLIYLSTMDSLFQIGYDTIPEVGLRMYRDLIWVDTLNQARLFQHLLGPDEKYYINMSPRCLYMNVNDTILSNRSRHLSVIEFPNKKHSACYFRKDGIQYSPPALTWGFLPNMPNYRLGASATPCNFTARELDFKYSLKVYPNPSSGSFFVETPNGFDGRVSLFNISGHQVYSTSHIGGKQEFNYGSLPSGIYLLRILGNAGEVHTQRIVVE